MKHLAISLFTLTLLLPVSTLAQQEENYDYWQPQRAMVQRGQQAVFMCNGLFTSNRSLEQIFAQELAFFREPIGSADGGDYNIDWNRRAVEIGASGAVPVMRAVFREATANDDHIVRGYHHSILTAVAGGRVGRS